MQKKHMTFSEAEPNQGTSDPKWTVKGRMVDMVARMVSQEGAPKCLVSFALGSTGQTCDGRAEWSTNKASGVEWSNVKVFRPCGAEGIRRRLRRAKLQNRRSSVYTPLGVWKILERSVWVSQHLITEHLSHSKWRAVTALPRRSSHFLGVHLGKRLMCSCGLRVDNYEIIEDSLRN